MGEQQRPVRVAILDHTAQLGGVELALVRLMDTLAERDDVEAQVLLFADGPLADDDGHVIGTFCAWDSEAHHWSTAEVQLMSDLSILVQELIFGR
mgnify:CR=1 FL=1